MSDRLIKEIITTTTEKFGDTGNVKERITETKERIYEGASADVSKEEKETQNDTEKEDLIKQVAEKIDGEHKQPAEEAPLIPKYNRVATPPPTPVTTAPTAFPWEQGR